MLGRTAVAGRGSVVFPLGENAGAYSCRAPLIEMVIRRRRMQARNLTS